MSDTNPASMTIRRPGNATRAPEGISDTPFWIETLLDTKMDGESTAIRVMMEPGTATHWHSHPRGQFLYVLSGVGLVQREGEPAQEVRSGDAVWFAPGELHWHGATPDSPFSYLSLQACQDGRFVDWAERKEQL